MSLRNRGQKTVRILWQCLFASVCSSCGTTSACCQAPAFGGSGARWLPQEWHCPAGAEQNSLVSIQEQIIRFSVRAKSSMSWLLASQPFPKTISGVAAAHIATHCLCMQGSHANRLLRRPGYALEQPCAAAAAGPRGSAGLLTCGKGHFTDLHVHVHSGAEACGHHNV